MKENRSTKQVIVMRKDLNMRKGKMVAQGAHASLAFITRRFNADHWYQMAILTDAEREWLQNSFAKITLSVDSLQQLDDIASHATRSGVTCHIITDNGRTEFNGVPTVTCLALGPDYSSKIDPITHHLKLL